MIRPTVTSSYKSGMAALTKDTDAKLERIVARAARDGSSLIRMSTAPPINAYATEGEEEGGHVRAGVFVTRAQWWATMFDKGTLGQRRVPLEQPGRREKEWRIKRRGKSYTARRSAEALASGGIEPQYFLVRGKRHAEERLGHYLRGGL